MASPSGGEVKRKEVGVIHPHNTTPVKTFETVVQCPFTNYIKMSPTANPLRVQADADQENRDFPNVGENNEFPLFPVSSWMKHQFNRLISLEERSLLGARLIKYLILQRCFLAPELPFILYASFMVKPPRIEGLPMNGAAFFTLCIISKIISAIFEIYYFKFIVSKIQKDAGLERHVSLEMFDKIDLFNAWTICAEIVVAWNMIYGIIVLVYLKCNPSGCPYVTSSDPSGSSVSYLNTMFIVNFVLIVLFPFIYYLSLTYTCCSTKKKEETKVLLQDIELSDTPL